MRVAIDDRDHPWIRKTMTIWFDEKHEWLELERLLETSDLTAIHKIRDAMHAVREKDE